MIDTRNTTDDWQTHSGTIAVLPAGSTEQHSAHLPLETDTLCAVEFARFLACELDAALLPTLSYATCLEHTGFRGSFGLRPETAMQVIRDLADEVERQKFTRLLVVNNHGGNHFLTPVCRDINRMDRPLKILLVHAWEYADRTLLEHADDSELHAGEYETSVMLALHPELVGGDRRDRPEPSEKCPALKAADLTTFGIGHMAPEGAVGFPRQASREKGEALIASAQTGMLSAVRDRLAALDRQPRYSGSGGLAIRSMTRCDIPDAMRLKTLAGWNQLEGDWNLYLNIAPDGCFCMMHNGRVVGTVTAVDYHRQSSWIGMVLVDPDFRRMGIATRLMEHAMQHLSGCSCIKLDATAAGKAVYDRLGFVDEYAISRFVHQGLPVFPLENNTAIPITSKDLDAAIAFDARHFGVERGALLRHLHALAPEAAWMVAGSGSLEAVSFGRPGAAFFQVGPITATTEESALMVLQAAFAQKPGQPVLLDVPDTQTAIREKLFSLGFSRQRSFMRMVRSDNIPGSPETFFAISGPELG